MRERNLNDECYIERCEDILRDILEYLETDGDTGRAREISSRISSILPPGSLETKADVDGLSIRQPGQRSSIEVVVDYYGPEKEMLQLLVHEAGSEDVSACLRFSAGGGLCEVALNRDITTVPMESRTPWLACRDGKNK